MPCGHTRLHSPQSVHLSGHMEGADDMEHLLLKGVHICLLCAVKLIAVKYALAAAAGRADISAGIAADAFTQAHFWK